MSIFIIGGLITSTFLSLLVIPVLFTYVDDIRAWMVKLPGRVSRRGKTAAPSGET
jgi:predicted RND superfamily exporter protein